MNATISQPTTRTTMMMTQSRIKTHALLLALSAVCAVTSSAADSVPYDLGAEVYKTEKLFSYDGCMDHQLMGSCGDPKVFKNNVYLTIIAHGRRPRVLQVPLDGGEAKIGRLEPDYVIGDDAHCYFTVGVDKAGYIHLTGGMHGGPWRYWVSAKPEDVSKFVPTVTEQEDKGRKGKAGKPPLAVTGEKGPPGIGITYPHFFTDTAGNLFLHARGSTPSFLPDRAANKTVHAGLLSMYDAGNRSWRLLGADIPKASGGSPGHPVTVWGDNFENGAEGGGWYVNNGAHFVPAPDNTLHFLFTILNYSPPSGQLRDSEGHSPGKDILYAFSKDGGRTLQRVDGSKVLWPVQAEAGPHQPDVIYAAAADYKVGEGGVTFSGLTNGSIELDWKNRPMIRARKRHADGESVVFRLENGKWVAGPAEAFGAWRDNVGVLTNRIGESNDIVRLWDENHSRVVKLGHEIEKLDEGYLRDTGTMIYTTKKPRAGNTVINVLRTTIQRPSKPTK